MLYSKLFVNFIFHLNQSISSFSHQKSDNIGTTTKTATMLNNVLTDPDAQILSLYSCLGSDSYSSDPLSGHGQSSFGVSDVIVSQYFGSGRKLPSKRKDPVTPYSNTSNGVGNN